MAKFIHTLGDSTLDNYFWMLNSDRERAERLCVEGQLRQRGHRVVSHAYDGFTTSSILNGDRVGRVLPPNSSMLDAYMRKKATSKDGVIHPLEELRRAITQRPKDSHYVVISVGGNDFRENLSNPCRLLGNISQIQDRYLHILKQIGELQQIYDVKPILVFQYRTDASNDRYSIYKVLGLVGAVAVAVHLACLAALTAPFWAISGILSPLSGGVIGCVGIVGLYMSRKIVPLSVTKHVLLGRRISMAMIGGLMESFYRPILRQAEVDQMPILDLPNTFNPYDESLYTCGIEPSEKGGELIAEGIDHIVRSHDFGGESALYAKGAGRATFNRTTTIMAHRNWQVAYPSKGCPQTCG